MLERLKKLLHQANRHVGFCEEFLLEAEINAKFNPSSANLRLVENEKISLAEKVNFRNVLAVKVRELETGVSESAPIEVTAMTVQNSLQI